MSTEKKLDIPWRFQREINVDPFTHTKETAFEFYGQEGKFLHPCTAYDEAIATMIEREHNSHAALVAAMKDCLFVITSDCDSKEARDAEQSARAALALAEGKNAK